MKNKRLWKLLLPIGLCAVEFTVMACYLYPKARSGELLSVRHASANLSGILGQSLVSFLFPAVLLILFALRLKKDFARQMYLRLEGKWQRITAGAFLLGILVLTVYCLIVKEDRVSILFSLLYYSVFVAFAEEFLCRDACTWFLRDFDWPVRYLIPNVCFAMLHVFYAAGWQRNSRAPRCSVSPRRTCWDMPSADACCSCSRRSRAPSGFRCSLHRPD
jgi:membrane protease YdiL (CAAX protease family)